MPRRLALLGAICMADFEDALQAAADHHLLVELRALAEVGFAVVILHLKHRAPSLGAGEHELRCHDLRETLAVQVRSKRSCDLSLNAKDVQHLRDAQRDGAMIE